MLTEPADELVVGTIDGVALRVEPAYRAGLLISAAIQSRPRPDERLAMQPPLHWRCEPVFAEIHALRL